MSAHVGVIRDGDGLAEAVRGFAALEREATSIAVRNMATTALLVAASAWARRATSTGCRWSGHGWIVPPGAYR